MPDDEFASLLENLTDADFAPPVEAPAAPAPEVVTPPVDQAEASPTDYFPEAAAPPAPAVSIEEEGDAIRAEDYLPLAATQPSAPTSPATEDVVLNEADYLPQAEAPAPPAPATPAPVTAARTLTPEEIAAQAAFMGSIEIERDVPLIEKAWMKHHVFKRVETVEEVREIVDAAIKAGKCALDTETQGLDTRITYDALGKIRTVHQIVGYCISYDGHTGYYIPVRHLPDGGGRDMNVPAEGVEREISRLCHASQPQAAPGATDPLSFKEVVEKPKVVIYFWNAKFDQEMLFPVTGIDWWHPDSYEDGMLACFCHFSADKAFSLKHKAPNQLRDQEGNAYVMIELKELFLRGRPIKFQTLSPDEPSVIKYGCSDAICTFLLCEPPRTWEKDRIDYLKKARDPKLYATTYRLEKQTTQVVRGMERHRVKVDKAKAGELLEEYRKEFTRLLGEIQTFASSKGYNLDPSSTKQLSDFLFSNNTGCLNIEPKPEKNEASGQYKTDGETLENMVKENPHAPPILKWIVEYRGVEKMIGTYLENLHDNPDVGLTVKNNELRFNFKQIGAGTGRFSAPAEEPSQGFSGVPIHGIPNESVMRKLFLARDGYTIVKADYAGQELRIAANVSGEPVWIKEFLEGDGDLHTITAKAFFGKDVISKDERKMGKIANFALIYGGGPQAIIRATGCDKMEASRRKQAFDKAVPTFAGWIKTQQKSVKDNLGVWTPFKRWLAIPDAKVNTGNPEQDRKVQAACERYSINYPIQGSGADIMKISMVMLHKEFHKRGWLKANPVTGYQGDDSVRMLLTVHDEIVFEIKHARVVEAVPVIVHTMEMPGKMATPRWVVPLVVEPLVGPNWGTGYKCDRVVERKAKAKREKKEYALDEGEFELNGFVYGTIREVDIKKDGGGEVPVEGEIEHARTDKKRQIRILDPIWITSAKTDDVAGPAVGAPVTASAPAGAEDVTPAPPKAPPAPAAAPASPKATGRIAVLRINRMTKETANQVFLACCDFTDRENGKILRLTDWAHDTLIDPSMNVKIDPKRLAEYLDKVLNIGDGRVGDEN